MVYGYARCSTNDQRQDIERQTRELKAAGADMIFSEYISGTTSEKPQLHCITERMQAGDTLVTTELSRYSRSVHQLCHLMEWAAHRRIVLRAGGFTADFTAGEIDPMAEGMFLMMGVFAQIEHKTTTQRIKSGVAHARKKGVRLGRPPLTPDKLPQEFLQNLPAYQKGALTKAAFAQLCNCSRPTLYRYLAIVSGKKL